jgi:hypothetical protein
VNLIDGKPQVKAMSFHAEAPSFGPRRIVEVLDHTFRIYRENFVVFVGMVALVNIPVSILSYLGSRSANESLQETQTTFEFGESTSNVYGDLLDALGALLGIYLLTFFIQFVLVYALITYITSENFLHRKSSFFQALKAIRSRIIPLSVAYVALLVILGGSAVLLTLTTSVCFFPIFGLPFVAYYGLCAFALAVPTITLERVGPFAGLHRATVLSKVRFWRVVGFMVSVGIIYYVVTIAFGILAFVFSGASIDSLENANTLVENNILYTILTTLTGIVLAPMLPIGLTLMYYDIRARVEALDIGLQVVDSDEPRPRDLPSPEPVEGLFTFRDVQNVIILFVIMGLIIGAIFAILFTILFSLAASI